MNNRWICLLLKEAKIRGRWPSIYLTSKCESWDVLCSKPQCKLQSNFQEKAELVYYLWGSKRATSLPAGPKLIFANPGRGRGASVQTAPVSPRARMRKCDPSVQKNPSNNLYALKGIKKFYYIYQYNLYKFFKFTYQINRKWRWIKPT